MSRLKEKYQKEVVKALASELGIKNVMQVPRLEKVIINTGVSDAKKNSEGFERLKQDLALMTGQYPSTRKARVSVASFALRKGMPVGLKVTLRGTRMYDFLDKLFSIVLPRLRDFRGMKRSSFDKNGNYTLGITEHSIFPEVDVTKSSLRGLEVTIVVKSDSAAQSFRLLELLGMPFEKEGEKVKPARNASRRDAGGK